MIAIPFCVPAVLICTTTTVHCSVCLSLHVADQATSEMNRKEKDIIRAYLRAVRYASHLESRVRIVLVGDTGTGGYILDRANVLKSVPFRFHGIPQTKELLYIQARAA